MRYKRLIYSAVAVVIIATLSVGAGVYAKSTLNRTELVHFFIPFPAGSVVRPMTVDRPDGGKVFTRPIVINVNERGILKRIFQPGLEGLSTHWLINIDSKPHRIGMKFTNVNVPIIWEVAGAIPWDPQSQTFKEAVAPGEQIRDLGIDWLFLFPPEIRAQRVWYEGSLVIFDADTGEELTIIPVKFQVSDKSGEASEDICCPEKA